MSRPLPLDGRTAPPHAAGATMRPAVQCGGGLAIKRSRSGPHVPTAEFHAEDA